MQFLKGISKEIKKDFLAKLASGKYTLGPIYDRQPGLTFDLMENGLYKCKTDPDRILSKEEICSLQGFMIGIDIVSDKDQFSGVKLPDSIILIPHNEVSYLNSLLKDKPV
ncbi:MAG: hypothetical protein M0P71_17035 [Melioribacteraceae bacterium]|jgi:hypothetical protein|nr:hypothetical protein [Melioribacteraceae bacterium]